MIKPSLRTGLSFGLTTGVITTIGIIIGLNASTHSKIAVIGGIVSLALVDSSADAIGIHISEESKEKTTKQIWEATITTFLSKAGFTLSFLVPLLLLDLEKAIIVSLVWGTILITVLSSMVARSRGENPLKAVAEHLAIATLAVIAINYIGTWISTALA